MSNDTTNTPKITSNPVVEALKAAQGTAQPATKPAPVEAKGISPELASMMAQILELKQKVDAKDRVAAQRIVDAAPPAIDWTKIEEKDIINLDLNIPVIEQEVPEFMNVVLKDKNYITRWVHQMGQRLGVCLASGHTYVSQEDMDPNYPKFLNFDTNGHYSFGDVVCLRILKSRYYPAIKANYMKTMAIHGKNKLQRAIATGKSSVELDRSGNEIRTNESIPEVIDPRRIHTYDPGDEQLPGEREYTRDMVQV